jgi:hypothetical protein
MDHTSHQSLEATELTEDNVVDAVIYGPDDEDIGRVSYLDGSGPTARVIVEVGGFLGIGSKTVALPVGQVNFMRDGDGNVYATSALTKEQVIELPDYDD